MPIVSDTTALRALAEVGSIGLLEKVWPPVVISPWVRAKELRRFNDEIDHAIQAGWMREGELSQSEVDQVLKGFPELHLGEAEVLALAMQERPPRRVLIDEGPAFRLFRDLRKFELYCLADVLHLAERNGAIPSAASLMQQLLDSGFYIWASPVWNHYQDRSNESGTSPVPRY